MTDDMTTTRALQALRLKGRPRPDDLAGAVGEEAETTEHVLAALAGEGWTAKQKGRYKLTPEGRAELDRRLDEERAAVNTDSLAQAYARFDEHNSAVKQVMTDWQLRDPETPNDHVDVDYDAAVIARLGEVHEAFTPLLAGIVDQVPRLDHYSHRLDHALDRVRGGEHSWLARPITDSYHTVWFELHEELIELTGRTRADEAAAGRAQ